MAQISYEHKHAKEIAGCKWVSVVTQLFNIAVNVFQHKKTTNLLLVVGYSF